MVSRSGKCESCRWWTARIRVGVSGELERQPLLSLLSLWRTVLAAVLAGVVWAGAVAAQDAKSLYTLQVDGLACPFCAYGIEKQLNAIDGVDSVETDIGSGTIVVTMEEGASMDAATAKRAVEAAGFTLRGFETGESAE